MKIDEVRPTNSKALHLMLMSLLFQSLELMRTNGIAEDGYATYVNGTLKLQPQVKEYLRMLKKLSSATGINQQNEIGFTVSDYLTSWQKRIIDVPTVNLLLNKKLKAISILDDDYNDIDILNDGTIGFEDYYNNWLINSLSVLSLETEMDGLENASLVEIDFLYDKKHKIYPPAVVTVFVGQRKYEQVLGETEEAGTRNIVKARIPIKTMANDEKVRIEIKKQIGSQKKLMACDEIIIR